MSADPQHLTATQINETWEHAERMADVLEHDGWICGHPTREDVEMVLRAAIYAGFIPPHQH